jgi:hypothetical protein
MIPAWNIMKQCNIPLNQHLLQKKKRSSLRMEDKLNSLELFKMLNGKSARLNTSKVPNLILLRALGSQKLTSKLELKIITGGEIHQEIRFMLLLMYLMMTVSLVFNHL